MSDSNEQIQQEMNVVIDSLKQQGIHPFAQETEIVGLGDIIESTLNTFGITQERFKKWFNLEECHCTERKLYLNHLFSWTRKKS